MSTSLSYVRPSRIRTRIRVPITTTTPAYMSHDRRHPRPRDPRQPRQSHRRSRRLLSTTASWAARPCRAARAPASTRPSSCATATPSATAARACCNAVQNVEETIAPALSGLRRHRPARHRRRDDRARRHAEQVEPRRQRDSRRLAGRRARGGAVRRAAALSLPRRPAVARACPCR